MFHEAVLKSEIVRLLVNDSKGIYVDGTLGGGGHAEEVLKHLDKKGKVIGLDLDTDAIEFSKKRLAKHQNQFVAYQKNFTKLGEVMAELQLPRINGILLDLGVSSHQLDTSMRGFSYRLEGKLDMRMDVNQDLTAHEVVNTYPEHRLVKLFKSYGEERRAKTIAHAITRQRDKLVINTTKDLQKIVASVLPFEQRTKSYSRIFQAIRIAVNEELENLIRALQNSFDYLANGGRIVVISYHSLEDRIVKDFFRQESKSCVCPPSFPICVCDKKGRVKILTKRPIRPSAQEIKDNPRSRSAKLRAAECILEHSEK